MVVLLLSTTHEQGTIDEQSHKPDIIEFYNSTKGAVDAFDQMCSNMSCSRKTQRWPLCIFYGMLNMTLVNGYVLYCHNTLKLKNKPMTRRMYARNLTEELMRPWLHRCLKVPTIRRSLKAMIGKILNVNPFESIEERPKDGKRKICAFCPSKLRRMTRFFLPIPLAGHVW